MYFNIETVPFSRYGSYFAISKVKDDIFLRDLHGGDDSPSNLFKLIFMHDNKEVVPIIEASETIIKFLYNNNYVSICFGLENTVNIQTHELTLKIDFIKNRYDSLIKLDNNTYNYDFYTKEIKYMFKKIDGNMIVDAPWKYVGNDYIQIILEPNSYLIIEEFKTVISYNKEQTIFNANHDVVLQEYNNFFNLYTKNITQITDQVKLAVYIMWSCVVHPNKNISDYSVYMSKNCMNNIWSWDNAFNAISLSKDFPELSFAQIELFFKFQDISGVFPDFINDNFVSYNCAKPPVHSWAFNKMRKNNDYFNNINILKKAYTHFKKQGEFWLNYRDLDNKFLPIYYHGNDSGWDNSSIFRDKLPVISPDLLCHLIRHFDIMEKLALELGYLEAAKLFRSNANKIFENLMNDFYVDNRFVARTYDGYEIIKNKNSLILFIPLIISYRFDNSILENLINILKSDFLTEYGLSTESLKSDFYKDDGYWLGPIWAAPMFLIIDALKNTSFNNFAYDLSNRFLKLINKGYMAENFNAVTGEGLSDKAFTWTSGVYLSILKEL